MPQSTNIYSAPITLGFTPSYGDLIEGTINGVEVSGEWMFNEVVLLDSSKNQICSVEFNGAQSLLVVNLPSAPTTDYELHLYRYVPAGIVKIPKEYVEGMEEGMIINSSTPDSTKKFKITVDDTGAISATEVT